MCIAGSCHCEHGFDPAVDCANCSPGRVEVAGACVDPQLTGSGTADDGTTGTDSSTGTEASSDTDSSSDTDDSTTSESGDSTTSGSTDDSETSESGGETGDDIPPGCEGDITFEDPTPDAHIKTLLHDPPERLRFEPIRYLILLQSTGTMHTSLVGIECFVELRNLTVNATPQLVDLSPVSELQHLTALTVGGSGVAGLSPISKLHNLESLMLGGAFIRDLSPITGLQKLKQVNFGYNLLTDISPLSQLPALASVLLLHNEITDLSPLSGLRSMATLDVRNNGLSDLSPLAGAYALKHLYIQNNEVSDISALRSLTALEKIHAERNLVSDLEPIVDLPRLYATYFQNNPNIDCHEQADNIEALRAKTPSTRFDCPRASLSKESATRAAGPSYTDSAGAEPAGSDPASIQGRWARNLWRSFTRDHPAHSSWRRRQSPDATQNQSFEYETPSTDGSTKRSQGLS